MPIQFRFNPEKTVEAAAVLLKLHGGPMKYLGLLKMLYETQIRPQVEVDNYGRIVAIDIATGEFELADDTVTAAHRLLEKYPGAQIWRVRIGHEAVYSLK